MRPLSLSLPGPASSPGSSRPSMNLDRRCSNGMYGLGSLYTTQAASPSKPSAGTEVPSAGIGSGCDRQLLATTRCVGASLSTNTL